MSRKEVLKALKDAIQIFERLEAYIKADGKLSGVGQLHRAKLYLQYRENEVRFVRQWTPRS